MQREINPQETTRRAQFGGVRISGAQISGARTWGSRMSLFCRRGGGVGVRLGRLWTQVTYLTTAILVVTFNAASVTTGCQTNLDEPSSTVPAAAMDQQSRSASPADIPRILKQLDSVQFDERQLATDSLVSLGSVSLRPLAKSYLDSSPEKRWRIKRVLEQLCIEGDEATFFKSAAILRTLFGGELTNERIVELQLDWKRKRTQVAAENLRSLGADVELYLPTETANEQIFFNLGGSPEPQAATTQPKPVSTAPPRIDPEELIGEIDRIIVGSIEQNRRIALADQIEPAVLTAEQQMAREFAVPELMFRNGIVFQDPLQGRVFVNGQMAFPDMTFFGSNVRLGKQWRGTNADVQLVAAIQNMTNIVFEDFKIDVDVLETLQRIAELRTITIGNCELTAAAVEKLSELKQLAQVTIKQQTLTEELASSIAAISELRMLSLNQVAWGAGAAEKLTEHKLLQAVSLSGMNIEPEFFDLANRLVNLRQVQMQGCKFNLDHYREFARRNPQLDINVTGRSFMGVRAPLNNIPVQFETPSCAISEVVPGSGAEAAGLQAGDEIVSINNEPIKAFQELVLLVSQHDPGKVIQVEYRRNQKLFKANVKLGDRAEAPQE